MGIIYVEGEDENVENKAPHQHACELCKLKSNNSYWVARDFLYNAIELVTTNRIQYVVHRGIRIAHKESVEIVSGIGRPTHDLF